MSGADGDGGGADLLPMGTETSGSGMDQLLCDVLRKISLSAQLIRHQPCSKKQVNPDPAERIYLNFQPLEVADRYRDPQHQVVENYL